jgi:drug/metabolite transporter (DMT)-like permease
MRNAEATVVAGTGSIMGYRPATDTWVEPARAQIDVRAYVYVVVMILLGSTTAAAAKLVVKEFPIAWLPVLRFSVAGLCVLPFVGGRPVIMRLIRDDWRLLLVSAGLCIPVNQAFFLNAARLGPTSHVGLFYATVPLVVLLLAWALRLERPDMRRLWGVVTSVLGVAVIGVGNALSGGNGSVADARSVVLADCLLIGAVLSWGSYVTVSKPLIMRHGAMPVLAATFLIGSLMQVPVAVLSSANWPSFAGISPSSWLALAVLALFITPVNLACQNLALKRLDASEVANFSNVSPVLTVLWGVWLFGESVTPALVFGGALTLVGITWACRPRREVITERVTVVQACQVG